LGSPYYLAIAGQFVLIGKQPDGDSVRFIPDNPAEFEQLGNAFRIRPTRLDGSVQLRFEGIDAAELHYGTLEQPMATPARDDVLSALGFSNLQYNGSTVTACEPQRTRGTILSKAADVNGRPISYVIPGANPSGIKASDWNFVGKQLLARTLNVKLLQQGLAYYTLYDSTPTNHRHILHQIAVSARNQLKGVWASDATDSFLLDTQMDIGPSGALILPKLFRRCSDYLKDKNEGFIGELADWLIAHSTGPRPEDDDVHIVSANVTVPLSTLIAQQNNRISFMPDLLDIFFVSK